MNKLLKKVVSGITTVSLGMAMIGTMPVVADETTASSTVRKLSVDFMGRGALPQESSPGKARLTADDKNKEFWVGVAVDNVNDLPLFTDGIYSLEIAFEYDPDFVEPYFTSENAETDWLAALASGNLAATNSSTWWNTEQYEIISVTETDINTTTDRENADLMTQREADGWKMCTVCVTLKNGASFDGARFKDLADATKQYLLKLPFKLNSVPDDDAADPNPTVLSLVRGPETLDIGSGETGTDPYSAWEATVTDPDDATNMKTLFTFAGDISLFDAGAVIEDIIPVKLKTDDETDDTTYTLSSTKDLNLDGFKAETLDYYLSVPNETEKLMLKITSSDLPTVVANSANVTTALISDKQYETAEFDLAELDKTVEADGYNNTVTVTASGTTYTLHIRRLLKPKVVLKPGNSPYGLIQQDDATFPTQTDKDAAKQAFADSHTTNKTYGTGMVPVGGQTTVNYTTVAWDDIGTNYDMVDETIFVYEAVSFHDPGIVIYDQLGEVVENPTVTKELTANVIKTGVPKYTDAEATSTVFTPTDDEFDLSGKIIRPDLYEITYEYVYTDMVTQVDKTITVSRPTVILSKRGDVSLTTLPLLNANDASDLKNNWTQLISRSKLFAFRSADVNITTLPLINANDASDLKKLWTKGFQEFYTELP